MAPVPDRSVRLGVPLALAALLAAAGEALPDETRFVVDAGRSRVRIHVGKAGLFKFAGHEHEVEARVSEGEIVANRQDLSQSSVRLRFEAADLRVTGRGEPPEDVPKVQEAMRGPRVLDAARFPAITYRSETVSGRESAPGVYELQVQGPLELRDHAVPIAFTVRVELAGGRLLARGKGKLRQSAFGIVPLSVGGVVKVKDELDLEFEFEAAARP